MKVLIVCSKNSGRISPFVSEQSDSLMKLGVEVEYFPIQGKGVFGYLNNYKLLQVSIKKYKPDLIHAHYGLSGLMANLQRRVPVITTYHGSDINYFKVLPFSIMSMVLSAHNIFVSEKVKKRSVGKNRQSLIPCGVDLNVFKPIEKEEARKKLGFEENEKLILFAGGFDREVKNPVLAQSAVKLLPHARLLELKGYTREQVSLLMNAADCLLLTSFSEGSPQFIKEGMACNRPIVATDVGDVHWIFGNEPGHFLAGFSVNDVTEKLEQALGFSATFKNTNGRGRIKNLDIDLESVAEKIQALYREITI